METIFHLIVFYYFLEIKNKIDKSLIIVTFVMCLSLAIRNTSPVGWVPLILYKIIEQRAILAFIKAVIFIAIPTIALIILIDSLYYGELAITAWNFLKINVIENRSSDFGVEPPLEFLLKYLP